MQKARLALIAVLVAIVPLAGIVGAWWYLRPKPVSPPKAVAPPPKTLPVVLTASKDLAVGSLITVDDLAWSPLKGGSVLSTHMLRGKTNESHVIGAVVRRALYKGTPLSWSAIVRRGEHGFLAAALRPNHRAVTISVDRATSEAALIYPGDHVDVILTVQVKEGSGRATNTFTGTILENIRVVAVNRQVESGAAGSAAQSGRRGRNVANTVTLELLPAEAERLILATSKGSISLAMRSLTDHQRRGERTPTTFENLLLLPSIEDARTASPTPEVATAEPAPPPPELEERPQRRVQIFRGSSYEEVTLPRAGTHIAPTEAPRNEPLAVP